MKTHRLSILLFVLLIVTQIAWYAAYPTWLSRSPRRGFEEPGIERLRRTNAQLRREIEKLEHVEEPESPDRAEPMHELPGVDRRAEIAARCRAWVADALQTSDAARRLAAIEDIRGALRQVDTVWLKEALGALSRVERATFDKRFFRPILTGLAKHPDAPVRAQAVILLARLAPDKADLQLVCSMATDSSPVVRGCLTFVMARILDNDLSAERTSAIVAGLLTDKDRAVVRQTFRSLGSVRVGPQAGRRLLELSRDRRLRNDVVLYALSKLAGKSEAVIGRLLEFLDGAEAPLHARILRGMRGDELAPASHEKVADFLVRPVEARSDVQTRVEALYLLGRYGSEKHIPALEKTRTNALVSRYIQLQTEEAIRQIRARGE